MAAIRVLRALVKDIWKNYAGEVGGTEIVGTSLDQPIYNQYGGKSWESVDLFIIVAA